jgi:hypothetical protein
MQDRRSFAALDAAIRSEAARAASRARPGAPAPDEAAASGAGSPLPLDRLYREEIGCSAALSGAALDPRELEALLSRGLALGGRPLETYIAAADYADAVGYLRAAPLAGPRTPFLRVEEIVEFHARATRRSPAARPGTWRATTAARLPGGVVPPPPWLVPRQIEAFVARLAPGPPREDSALLWVAQAHERFHRIHPFARANGRTGRLVTNLLLRRLGLPPFIVRPREHGRYLAALQRADSRDPWPLAAVVARSVLAGLRELAGRGGEALDLRPLVTFAAGAERAALYKAVQRGRLQAVRRDGALQTSEAWLASYHASRHARAK